MPHTYLLKHGAHQRIVHSTGTMVKNEPVRIARPADDRAIKDDFVIHIEDYEIWRVEDIAPGHIELPDGGFGEIKIVTLRRECPDVQPDPITPGG